MGCCESRNQELSMMGTINRGMSFENLDKLKEQNKWESIVQFINIDDELEESCEDFGTIGGKALHYLRTEGAKSPQTIGKICLKHTQAFLKNFTTNSDELINMTMAVFYIALEEDNKPLKQEMISQKIFSYLVVLFSSPNEEQRIMATHLSSRIYAKDPKMQMEFFNYHGDRALVKYLSLIHI